MSPHTAGPHKSSVLIAGIRFNCSMSELVDMILSDSLMGYTS